MGQPTQPSVPDAVRPVVEEICAITDAFAAEHLDEEDEEYAQLCRRLTAKLARKRPSPLLRGGRQIWAAGILAAIGRVNFLSDPSQSPHVTNGAMAAALGVKEQTMGNKARLISDMFGMTPFDAEWARQEMAQKNPYMWLLEFDGLLVDARELPREIQEEAVRRGLIPHLPG